MSTLYTPTKKQTSLYLDLTSIEYFKKLSKQTGIPYQRLVNLYLADCVKSRRVITVENKDGHKIHISPDF